jgi:copper(I)-binding protein
VKRSVVLFFLLCGSLISCSHEDGPSLDVKNVRILAPLPGSDVGVAYFDVVNNTDAVSHLINMSSPQYGQVAMHETTETKGIARMRPVSTVPVPANSEIKFSSGGLHVMLIDPLAELGPGSQITIQLHFEDNLLIVSTMLQPRRIRRGQ